MTAKILKEMVLDAFLDFCQTQGMPTAASSDGIFHCHSTRKSFFTFRGAYVQGYIAGDRRFDIAINALKKIAEGGPAPRATAQLALDQLSAKK